MTGGPAERVVAVLLDEPAAAWQREAVRVLEASGVRVGVVRHPRQPPPRPAAVTLYARLDRWPPPSAGDGSPGGEPEAPALVVDLTSTRASAGRRYDVPLLVVEPAALDEDALLPLLAAGRRTLGLEVQRHERSGSEVVARSTVSLNRFSARRSAERAGHRAAALVGRAVAGVRSGLGAEPEEAGGPPPRAPASTGAVGRLLLDGVVAGIELRTRRVDWRVHYGAAVPDDPFALPATPCTVAAPVGRFYADPFLAATGDGTFLFVEDFDLAKGRASLSAVELATGNVTGVLSADHHLSYPFVLEVDGTWYMTPEAAESRRVVLHRCTRFPDRWEPDAVLLDGVAAYDPTLVHRDGLWWLFFAAGTPGSAADDELHVWFSPSLRGPFEPHPANPVRSTVRGARPGGRILESGGRLLRPGQDGSREYGGEIVLFEIERLTTSEYRERPVRTLGPSALGAEGLHTIDSGGGLVVVDTKHRVPRRLRG